MKYVSLCDGIGAVHVALRSLVWMSDTQRYMMIGNSMATPVVQWIGRRIEMVEQQRDMGKASRLLTVGPDPQREFDEMKEI